MLMRILSLTACFMFVLPTQAVADRYDYMQPGIEETIQAETGISLNEGYRSRRCIPASKTDSCLPTGYIDAVEKGEPFKTLWDVEVMLVQERDAEADALLRKLAKRYPKEPKVMWLLAKNLFFRAERLPGHDSAGRGQALKEAIDWTVRCVETAPKDINCHLHRGALLARLSTNNGVVRSVLNGTAVQDAWKEAVRLNTHYRFPSANTSWGAANYGLGIFKRLVPDSFWLNLIFGFKGDIDQSIAYLKAAQATKDDQVEVYTELAAAYFCKHSRDGDVGARNRANEALTRCLDISPPDRISEISQEHCRMLRASPEAACGYSRDKQQETSIARFKEEFNK